MISMKRLREAEAMRDEWGEGAESEREMAGVGQKRICTYCGTEYVKKDERQHLCLPCTVEQYL